MSAKVSAEGAAPPASSPVTAFLFTYSDSAFGVPAPWPLVTVVSSAFIYLLLVYVIWPRFRPESAASIKALTRFRYYHNVFMSLYSGFCCFTTAAHMYQVGELSIVKQQQGLAADGGGASSYELVLENMFCTQLMPDWIYYLNLSFILSKVYEWLDTAFLVWLTKRGPTAALSFLHVFHHATTLWLFLLSSNFASSAKMGMLLNGFVHFLMYWHYARPFPKPIVPLITTVQILQLSACIYTWTYGSFYCSSASGMLVASSTSGGSTASNVIAMAGAASQASSSAAVVTEDLFTYFQRQYPLEFMTPYALVPVYLILFLKFFVQRFLTGSTRKEVGESKKTQ